MVSVEGEGENPLLFSLTAQKQGGYPARVFLQAPPPQQPFQPTPTPSPGSHQEIFQKRSKIVFEVFGLPSLALIRASNLAGRLVCVEFVLSKGSGVRLGGCQSMLVRGHPKLGAGRPGQAECRVGPDTVPASLACCTD